MPERHGIVGVFHASVFRGRPFNAADSHELLGAVASEVGACREILAQQR
jgi:hypothetical protein